MGLGDTGPTNHSPLSLAIESKYKNNEEGEEFIKFLICRGVDVNLPDKKFIRV